MEIGTFEFGLYIFNRLNAKALLIASAHPNANLNGKSDVLNRFNTDNIFNIVHYSIFKKYRNESLQAQIIRGMGYEQAVKSPNLDVIISEANNLDSQTKALANLKSTQDLLTSLGLENQTQNEQNQYALGLGTNSIENQLRYQANKQVVTQWISPRLIDNLRQSEEQWLNNKHFVALDIQSEVQDIYSYLNSSTYAQDTIDENSLVSIDKFITSDNLVYILEVINNTNYTFSLITDIDSKSNFLIVKDRNNIVAVRNLNAINAKQYTLESNIESIVDRYISNRAHWLLSQSQESE